MCNKSKFEAGQQVIFKTDYNSFITVGAADVLATTETMIQIRYHWRGYSHVEKIQWYLAEVLAEATPENITEIGTRLLKIQIGLIQERLESYNKSVQRLSNAEVICSYQILIRDDQFAIERLELALRNLPDFPKNRAELI
jgi:hypothetical protein